MTRLLKRIVCGIVPTKIFFPLGVSKQLSSKIFFSCRVFVSEQL